MSKLDEGTKPIRILLADDHALVREGFRALIEKLPGVTVVAEASEGEETLDQVRRHLPDIVLMDIAMPGMNGLEVTARITQELPQVRVIILSMHADERYIRKAVSAGAAGYLLKGASRTEFELAIMAVSRGDTYLSPAVSKQVLTDYARQMAREPSPSDQLTPRQREILQFIAKGLSTEQIAERLCLSAKTVHTHREQLMRRLGIHDIAGLVRYAIRTGLVSLDE